MQKILALLALMALGLTACAPAAGTQAPAQAAPTAQGEAPAATPGAKTDFTPNDPATVNLALGRPQLVEFFAYD
ncbi:MAG: hypothetical protein ACRDH2_09115 [Anaerolineales bacterium]